MDRVWKANLGVLVLSCLVGSTLLAMSSPIVASGTPTVTATPTATATPSAQQVARFTGEEWVDAQSSSADVTARIGSSICGTGGTGHFAESAPPYHIQVVSDQITPGCGREGSIITFLVGDRLASETAVWHAASDSTLNLIVGPPFALVSGTTSLACNELVQRRIVPFVNGVVCGNPTGGGLALPCSGGLADYTDVVLPAQLQPGCGVEGSQIAFKLLDAQGDVVATAQETGVWHAWDGGVSSAQQLNLTFVPASGMKMGTVGTGAGSQGIAKDWGALAIALCGVGLGGIGAGVALRGKTTRR